MARVWYHLNPSSHEWEEWDAGTIPSGISVFNAHFLNQFKAWYQYLRCIIDQEIGAQAQWVHGNNAQSPSFWNDLANLSWFGPVYAAPQDHTVGNVVLSGWGGQDGYRVDKTDEWADASSDDILNGHDLITEYRIQNILVNIRTRLDLCSRILLLQRPAILADHPTRVLRIWSSDSPLRTVTETDVDILEGGGGRAYWSDGRSSPFWWQYRHLYSDYVRFYPSIVPYSATVGQSDFRLDSWPLYTDLTQVNTGANYEYAKITDEVSDAAISSGPVNVNVQRDMNGVPETPPNTGGIDSDSYQVYWFPYAHPLDELPDVCKPPGGFPWD